MTPLAWSAASLPFAADPSSLLPARQMMAFTLGFHIVLVPFGVAFTFLMLIANHRALRLGDRDALTLARRWSHVAAVLFAVGAVSGTVLSFEMGLLWPGLMGRFGAAYGFPFAIEGLFFFLEAIFVAIYIYGWDRMAPWPHFWTGVPVVLNTSFNLKGEPIVNTAQEAFHTFTRSGMDLLVLGEYVIEKLAGSC